MFVTETLFLSLAAMTGSEPTQAKTGLEWATRRIVPLSPFLKVNERMGHPLLLSFAQLGGRGVRPNVGRGGGWEHKVPRLRSG